MLGGQTCPRFLNVAVLVSKPNVNNTNALSRFQ